MRPSTFFVAYAANLEELEQCARAEGVREVLLEPALLACQGSLTPAETFSLAREAKARGLRPVLVWDILMPQRVMDALAPKLEAWDWGCFEAVRVCDIGAAQWLRVHHPAMPIQLSVETGNHNEDALRTWCEIFAPALERLILSIELPEERLIAYCRELPVPCEMLGVGRILLFYSPRSLLASHLLHEPLESAETSDAIAAHSSEKGSGQPDADAADPLRQRREDIDAQRIEAVSASELSAYRPLPVLETAHGTFLFLDKDQFILDRLEGLRDAGLASVRLDIRHLRGSNEPFAQLDQLVAQMDKDADALRKAWPRPTRAPFFRSNKTTAQFSRMKSSHHAHRDEHTLAEVIGLEKRRYVVLCATQSFSTSMIHSMILPSGEEIMLEDAPRFRDLQGQFREEWDADQLLITDRIRMACPGALLRSRPLGTESEH
ncbi:MAG: U32 family peptidase [Myxococcales bacterium]|nr:U32 family peptidase [Myxococcales bacterium]